jgi:hypothetical protein
MNLLRYLRALEARNVEILEDSAQAAKTGKLKGSDLNKEQWEEIKKFDAIWDAFINPNKDNDG